MIYAGFAIFFIFTLQARVKRRKVINALNRLRSIAHLVDAHQLTKDPISVSGQSKNVTHSPTRDWDAYGMSRYLNYCSEMLALTGKVAFLYVQKFDDPISVAAVNDIETLCGGMSSKIWSKIGQIDLDKDIETT